ncbi:MAG: amino acid racemase [Bacteroidetes bacterium]|nr:amino acid racemase [Bacteroidota bacterium]
MNTLGMIGGTSWHATEVYYRLIQEGVAEKIGAWNSPPLILHSINIAIMRSQDKEKIREKYLETANKLESAGAQAIAICANTPHLVYDFVQPQIGIPFLHIADATGREAERLGLKKLAILGNKPTMTGSFISGYVQEKYNIEVIRPEGDALDKSHRYVSEELTQGNFTNDARHFYLEEINQLQSRGADGIILGCTELPILLKDDKAGIPMLATTDLHAQMAVEFILGKEY